MCAPASTLHPPACMCLPAPTGYPPNETWGINTTYSVPYAPGVVLGNTSHPTLGACGKLCAPKVGGGLQCLLPAAVPCAVCMQASSAVLQVILEPVDAWPGDEAHNGAAVWARTFGFVHAALPVVPALRSPMLPCLTLV